jgi:hypothetical protein
MVGILTDLIYSHGRTPIGPCFSRDELVPQLSRARKTY